MERVNRILRHPDFLRLLGEIETAEKDRIYCGHGAEHLLSAARLAALIADEEHIPVDRPLLYAAALVHDLGRAEEYEKGTPHEEAGPRLAEPILRDCGFGEEELAQILTAVNQHRSAYPGPRTAMGELLCRADKESRPCMLCRAADTCNWPMEKRNLQLKR